MADKLKKAKVLQQIQGLPSKWKGLALRHLNTPKTRRRGSEVFAQQHPKRAVTEREKLLMREMHKQGLSFRALEEVFHLIPNEGNAAQRCVKAADKLARRKARAASAV